MELHELYAQLDDMPNGAAKKETMKEAIRLADRHNNREYCQAFREMLLEYRDVSVREKLVALSWLLADKDRHNEEVGRSLLFEYQQILMNVCYCPEISKDTIYAVMADFRKRLHAKGYGDIDYYEALLWAAAAMDDRDVFNSAYEAYYLKPDKRKAMAPCPAYAIAHKIHYLGYMGDFEAIQHEFKFFQQKRSCYCRSMVCDFCNNKELGRAYNYFVHTSVNMERPDAIVDIIAKSYKLCVDADIMDFESAYLIYFARIDKEEGLRIYKEQVEECTQTALQESFDFELGAAVLMKALGNTIFMAKLSPTFAKYQTDGKYSAAELASYHYNNAKASADRFDKRNGTDKYNKQLQKFILK